MPDPRQLSLDWTDALAVVREAGLTGLVKPLYLGVELTYGTPGMLPLHTGKLQDARATYLISMNPIIASLPHVERVEALVYVAAVAIGQLQLMASAGPAFLCPYLGCANTNLAVIRERWRRIGLTAKEHLVERMFEDRAKCGWCKGALVTGSAHPVRADIHEGCFQYLKTVIAPQQRAAFAELRRQATAEVDK